uniref:hypothetical protein n=1 Tax=Herbidospora sakaeratensis TaxID=564415 RepID=UPI0007822CBC|nr:hypothetical protein [Herbidospora sakaeratensis]
MSAGRLSTFMSAELRAMPLFRQSVPMESGLGWPIPVRHRPGWDGSVAGVFVRIPLFGFRGRPTGGTDIYPFFATITVDWRTRRAVEYADLRYTRPWKPWNREPAGVFPHASLRGSKRAYLEKRDALLSLYDEMLDGMLHDRPFGAGDEFGRLLRELLEPPLERYYRLLGPAFFGRFLGPDSP